MMFEWKILEVTSYDEQITHAKYKVTVTSGDLKVESEGNAYADFTFGIKYSEITEQNVINTIKNLYTKDGINLIESNLEHQLQVLSKQASTTPPWHVETFKVEV
jgi:hypothetical protein